MIDIGLTCAERAMTGVGVAGVLVGLAVLAREAWIVWTTAGEVGGEEETEDGGQKTAVGDNTINLEGDAA